MKAIYELDLRNIEEIDRYLSGEMTETEKQAFHIALRNNAELRDDFRMVLDTYTGSSKAAKISYTNAHFLQSLRLSRKSVVARDLVNFGLMALLGTFSLAVLCLVLVAFVG